MSDANRSTAPDRPVLNVAIAGLGAVGMPVARWLDSGVPGLRLSAVSLRDRDSAPARLSGFRSLPPVCDPDQLSGQADIVVEALPPALFRQVAEPALAAGRILMPLSVTQLLDNMDLVDLAGQTGGRIIVPTGALLGLDAVRAAAQGEIRSVRMITRKPPAGLASTPLVQQRGLDLSALTAPVQLYAGPVREAARLFPANVNVAVALALAGVGVDRTGYEVWADPAVDRNIHEIEVEADSTRFRMEIAGVPTAGNPATGRLTPLSTIAALQGLVSVLRVGS